MAPLLDRERVAARTERTYWGLAGRDMALICAAIIIIFGLVWVTWNQSQLNQVLAGHTSQLHEQSRQLSDLSKQLTEHERSRASAEAKRPPTTIVVPPAVGTSTTVPPPSGTDAGITP